MHNFTKILINLMIMLVSAMPAYGKATQPKIVVSTTPVASLVKMLVGPNAEVIALNNTAGCPHHYHGRPSDQQKIQTADMVIYINERFDGYMAKMTEHYHGVKFKISDISTINLTAGGTTNWHFWLDPDKAILFQTALLAQIQQTFPQIAPAIAPRFDLVIAKMQELKKLRQHAMQNITRVILLTDSLEHLFNQTNIEVIKSYKRENSSLKYLSDLTKIIKQHPSTCLVLDQSQDPKLYDRFHRQIAVADGENWLADQVREELFSTKYREIINSLPEIATTPQKHYHSAAPVSYISLVTGYCK